MRNGQFCILSTNCIMPLACAGFFIGAVRTCGVCRIFILGVGEPVCVQDWENLCYVQEFFLGGSGG